MDWMDWPFGIFGGGFSFWPPANQYFWRRKDGWMARGEIKVKRAIGNE
jgi:hypothetical protein